MRETLARDVVEPKDSLSQDWPVFMAAYFPEAQWLPVPNLGAAVASFATQWQLNGIILSGGNDLNSSPLRNETEIALLTWATRHEIPVFGVCRGMEMIQHYFGGQLTYHPEHSAEEAHPVEWLESGERFLVNSFHQWGIATDNLAPPLQPLAVTNDGLIEALQHPELPLLGVQWHPERSGSPTDLDLRLMRDLFKSSPAATPRPMVYS